MKDKIVTGLANDGHIRIMAISSTQMVQEAKDRHDLWPTASAALGRLMSVSALLGAQLKNEDEVISVRIDGDGELGLMRVDAAKTGAVRGFVMNPHVMLVNDDKHLDVGKAVGKGTLSVSRNYGLKNEFTSSIELVSGEIGDDFAMYFTQSEQLPSVVSVGVLVNKDGNIDAAGALLIQMMPGHTESDINMAEYVVEHLKPISQMIQEKMTPEMIVTSLFNDTDVLAESAVEFKCHCNHDKMRETLKTLTVNDLTELAHEDDGATLECQYCNTHYHFDKKDLMDIIQEKKHVEDSKA